MSGEELEHVVMRESLADPTLSPDDLRGRPESVQDCLFGCIDDRFEDVVQVAVGHRRQRRLAAGPPAWRREGDEDLATAVMSDRAAARQPEPGATRNPFQLLR